MRSVPKTLACLACFVAGLCTAQTRRLPHEWAATIKAIDDTGKAVPGAETWVSYSLPGLADQSKNWDKIAGFTDTNGIFKAFHEDQSVSLGFHARKEGYYPAGAQHFLGFSADDNAANWNPDYTLLLNRIVKPIPMYAKRVMEQPPRKDTGVGYDLEAGDWVEPYGRGQRADIIFTSHFDKRADNDWDYKLMVSFPNAGDGIQPFETPPLDNAGHPFRYSAPESGYAPQWTKTQNQRPETPAQYGIDDTLKFFFRVRSVLDEKGNVRIANYGKIYGDFMKFRYYLNPVPNNRNVEFDPKHNLLPGGDVSEP